jgi:hypothetical protein
VGAAAEETTRSWMRKRREGKIIIIYFSGWAAGC